MHVHIRALATKASEAKSSLEALQYSQASANLANAFGTLEANRPEGLSDEQVKYLVARFLCWKLPTDFSPDGGISFEAEYNVLTKHPSKHEPIGTNLLDAGQAEAMVRHMLIGMP